MKAPKCPKCGKEHFSTQRCGAKLTPMGSPPADAGETVTQRTEGAASAGPKQSEASGMLQGPPLTPAEKQKAYRERLKDDPGAYEEYLEANKLRMRKKRE